MSQPQTASLLTLGNFKRLTAALPDDTPLLVLRTETEYNMAAAVITTVVRDHENQQYANFVDEGKAAVGIKTRAILIL